MMREHIPTSRRSDTAISLIRSFVDFGFEKADFAEASEECDVIRQACVLVFEHEDDEEEDYDYEEEE